MIKQCAYCDKEIKWYQMFCDECESRFWSDEDYDYEEIEEEG